MSREGRLTGIPYTVLVAPDVGMKGRNIFIKGVGKVNKSYFHSRTKRDILRTVGKVNYSKIVGGNPDVIVDKGEIVLKGVERSFQKKSMRTGLKANDFFE